jgi:hypothetical protein
MLYPIELQLREGGLNKRGYRSDGKQNFFKMTGRLPGAFWPIRAWLGAFP